MIDNFFSIGRKKNSIAKVTLISGSPKIIINGKSASEYLQNNAFYISNIQKPLQILGLSKCYQIHAKAHGGGLSGQSSAIQLAVARVLCKLNPIYRSPLRLKALLSCDARRKERRKYGLKKARKAPQFSKR